MSTLGNKEIMAQNIRYYLKKYGKTQKEICKDLGFKEMTFSDWVNAKTYPRIDKIEKIANYFHVQKADLVEEKRKPLKNIVPIERCMVPIIGQIAAGNPKPNQDKDSCRRNGSASPRHGHHRNGDLRNQASHTPSSKRNQHPYP